MVLQNVEKLRYPIGRYEKGDNPTGDKLNKCISTIENFPAQLEKEVSSLTPEQLDTPYRPGGWTIRQLVHHCADSHMNSLIRFKLALTEKEPTIKPYFEDRWAELPDSQMPVEVSLQLLAGLHNRWAFLLKSLNSEQIKKTFLHPEHTSPIRLEEAVSLYDWHCRHHLAHIIHLKKWMEWA